MPGMVRVVRLTFVAFVCAIAVNCESPEESQPRTCVSEQCDGFELELKLPAARDLEEVASFVQARVNDLSCQRVRARGTVLCAPSSASCGWDSLEETAHPQQQILDALAQFAGDAGVDGGMAPVIVVDDCACRYYVENVCPH